MLLSEYSIIFLVHDCHCYFACDRKKNMEQQCLQLRISISRLIFVVWVIGLGLSIFFFFAITEFVNYIAMD